MKSIPVIDHPGCSVPLVVIDYAETGCRNCFCIVETLIIDVCETLRTGVVPNSVRLRELEIAGNPVCTCRELAQEWLT